MDIQNGIDFEKLKERFPSPFYSYKNAGSYCKKDSYIRLDDLKNDLSRSDKDLFVTGISSFLRMMGKDELQSQLRILLDLPIDKHVVIITYQCSKYLDFPDKRLYELLYHLKFRLKKYIHISELIVLIKLLNLIRARKFLFLPNIQKQIFQNHFCKFQLFQTHTISLKHTKKI